MPCGGFSTEETLTHDPDIVLKAADAEPGNDLVACPPQSTVLRAAFIAEPRHSACSCTKTPNPSVTNAELGSSVLTDKYVLMAVPTTEPGTIKPSHFGPVSTSQTNDDRDDIHQQKHKTKNEISEKEYYQEPI